MKHALIIAALCAVSLPALAARVPTTLKALPSSMSDLLNGGWKIVSGSMSTFILTDGPKWVFCSIDTGAGSGEPPTSDCMRLN